MNQLVKSNQILKDFYSMSQKIIKLTEGQLRDIVYEVISKQRINEDTTTGLGYNDVGLNTKPTTPSAPTTTKTDPNQAAIENIANIYSTVDKSGIIKNPASMYNGKTWKQYYTDQVVTPEQLEAAKKLLTQRQTTQNTQNQRYVNIANAMASVDPTTLKINNPKSSSNGMSWADYVKTYNITQDDITKAQAYVASLSKTNPAAATKAAAGVAAAAKVSKPDPQVMELQKQLKAAGYNLGTSGPNKDGIDGIMGSRTKAAQQLMVQKGQQGVQDMAKQGQQFMNKLNSYGKTTSQLTPQQQAVADALKNGQPLPGSTPTTQTATPPPAEDPYAKLG